ncbi:MAG: hypothetical protein ACOC5R_01390 [Elusimicrobiota bacterium]
MNTIWDRLIRSHNCWNENKARLHERIFPIMTNLVSPYASHSYGKAEKPEKKGAINV